MASPQPVTRLKLVVCSPSDTQEERKLVALVAAELNDLLALKDAGIVVELFGYEKVPPATHHRGPQGQIDKYLPIERADLVIGVFWRRFGTVLANGYTGTEHELRNAYGFWERTGKPEIKIYFNQEPYAPTTSEELEEWKRVLVFRDEFYNKGLVQHYVGSNAFERLVRRHILEKIWGPVSEQATGGHECLKCSVVSIVPYVRAESITDRMGDIALAFDGAFPQGVDRENIALSIDITLNTSITNWQDAEGMTDVVLDLGTGSLLRAQRVNSNTVSFKDVRIGEGPDDLMRNLVIRNLRAHVAELGRPTSSAFPECFVRADVKVYPSNYPDIVVKIANSPVKIGRAILSCLSDVEVVSTDGDAPIFETEPSTRNEGLALEYNPENVVASSYVVVEEGFKGAFCDKRDEFGDSRVFPSTGASGTRFLMRFFHAPDAARLYVCARDIAPNVDGPTPPRMDPNVLLVDGADANGVGGAIVNMAALESESRARCWGSPVVRLKVSGGFSVAVFEWVGDPNARDQEYRKFTIGLALALKPGQILEPGVMIVSVSLAPVTTSWTWTSMYPTIPRFIDTNPDPQTAIWYGHDPSLRDW